MHSLLSTERLGMAYKGRDWRWQPAKGRSFSIMATDLYFWSEQLGISIAELIECLREQAIIQDGTLDAYSAGGER